jgi:hypothetical protein
MTLFLALSLALVVSALVLALLLRLAPRTGLVGQALAVPEALMFALALAVFGG